MKKHVAILIFFQILFLFLFFISENPPFFLSKKAKIGNPYIFSKEAKYFSKIIDYALLDNSIYILYHNDILQVYHLDGSYCYSVFFKRKRNGISSLHIANNKVYYRDGCQLHLYEVSEDGCIFYDYQQEKEKCNQILKTANEEKNKVNEERNISLYIRNGNVYVNHHDNIEMNITQRGLLYRITQSNILLYVFLLLTAINIIVIKIR